LKQLTYAQNFEKLQEVLKMPIEVLYKSEDGEAWKFFLSREEYWVLKKEWKTEKEISKAAENHE